MGGYSSCVHCTCSFFVSWSGRSLQIFESSLLCCSHSDFHCLLVSFKDSFPFGWRSILDLHCSYLGWCLFFAISISRSHQDHLWSNLYHCRHNFILCCHCNHEPRGRYSSCEYKNGTKFESIS